MKIKRTSAVGPVRLQHGDEELTVPANRKTYEVESPELLRLALSAGFEPAGEEPDKEDSES